MKIENKINQYVADFMIDNYNFITDITIPQEEDYKSYDIIFTATTTQGEIIEGTQEVKSILHYPLKVDGEFRDYFSNNTAGIKTKFLFGNVPEANPNTDELPFKWVKEPTYAKMPEEIKDKPIYILNAEDLHGNIKNSKWHHMHKNKTGLTIVAEDGLIMFNHKQLKSAFLGYGWYKNKSHTELINKKYDPRYELKAIIDISKGKFYKKDLNNLFKNNN